MSSGRRSASKLTSQAATVGFRRAASRLAVSRSPALRASAIAAARAATKRSGGASYIRRMISSVAVGTSGNRGSGRDVRVVGAGQSLQVTVRDLRAGGREQRVVQRERPLRLDRADEVDGLGQFRPW